MVPEVDDARAQRARPRELGERQAPGQAALRHAEAHRQPLLHLEGGGVVGDDHRVPGGLVPEVIEEAVVLEEPRDEVEVRLAVLDDELARLVLLRDPPLDLVAEAGVLEDRLRDLDDGLLLEDAAPLAVRERGQRGPQADVELAALARDVRKAGAVDDAVVEPLLARRVDDAQAEAAAQAVLDRNEASSVAKRTSTV